MFEPERKTIFLYRHTSYGRSQIVPCNISRMTLADHREAERLHIDVTRGLSPEVFSPTPPEDLIRLLGDEGIALGVWYGPRLVSMRAIQTDRDWVNEVLVKMGMEAEIENRTAFTEHCIVDREFRGNNIQFISHYKMENYIADRFERITTTVSPRNPFSLKNVFACNFLVVGIKELYGGYTRYIMEKNFVSPASLWSKGHMVIPVLDIERQRRLLAEGYVGYQMIRKDGALNILYAPSCAECPPRRGKSEKD